MMTFPLKVDPPESSSTFVVLPAPGNGDLAQNHEQVKNDADGERPDGESMRVRGIGGGSGQQQHDSGTCEQCLDNQVQRQERRLPEVAAFALSKKECGISCGQEARKHSGPEQDERNLRNPDYLAQPESGAQPAIKNQEIGSFRQPGLALRRQQDAQRKRPPTAI